MPRQFGVPEEVISKVISGALPPSSYSEYLSPLHDRHVIGVNNAYLLGPWIGCLFFGDCGWYVVHRKKLAEIPILKVTCCSRFANKSRSNSEGIKYLSKDSNHRQGITTRPTMVSWNSNSGAAAINLAAHFRAKRIILLGFDMSMGGSASHWHQGHGAQKPPPFKKHLQGFPAIAEDATRLGIEILNANPDSAIDCFPRVNLRDLL